MDKLNVLFLNSWYPNTIYPLNGNFIQQHARAVSLCCNVVCLHVKSRVQSQRYEISKQWNEGVLEIIIYYKKNSSKSVLSLFAKQQQQHRAFLKGFDIVTSKFFKIDIVHLNVMFPAGLFAIYLKIKFNIPYIVTEHSTTFLKISPLNHSRLETFFIKRIINYATVICPVSKDLATAINKYGSNLDVRIVPNVVNTKFFKYVNKKRTEKTINLLHISSLKEEHKNLRGLLNVVKSLSEKRSDFTLTIISNNCANDVVNYASKIGLLIL